MALPSFSDFIQGIRTKTLKAAEPVREFLKTPVYEGTPLGTAANLLEPVSSFVKHRVEEPFKAVPGAIKSVVQEAPNLINPFRTPEQRLETVKKVGVGALQTVGGLSPFGPEDFVMAAYDALKAKGAKKDVLKGFTGEEYTPLGEAIPKQSPELLKKGLTAAELPLLLFGGMKTMKGADLLSAAKKAEGAADVAKTTPDVGAFAEAVPDAKAVAETLTAPGREHGLVTSVKESAKVGEEIKTKITGTYNPITNEQTLASAEKAIAKNSEAVRSEVLKEASGWNADIASKGQLLAIKLEKEGNIKAADEIWQSMADKATEAGQGNQALRYLGSKSPKGIEDWAKKTIDEANEKRTGFASRILGTKPIEFTKEFEAQLKKDIAGVRGLDPGPARDAAVKKVIETVGKQIPPTASEIFDAYRYNNLLSSPNTWGPTGKNFFFNTLQAFFTKPAKMGYEVVNDVIASTLFGKDRTTYLKDIPTYYKAMVNSLPQAGQASLSVLSGKTPIQHKDLTGINLNNMNSYLQEVRQRNIPGNLNLFFGPKGERLTKENMVAATQHLFTKLFSSLMEMNDKFFQSAISNGEFAVQKSRGVDDVKAMAAADKEAKYLLARNAPEPGVVMTKPSTLLKSEQGPILAGIDAFEKQIAGLRAFKPVSWLIPFLNTATQLGKMGLEFSPLGAITIPGNANKMSQLAKIELGTTATLLTTLLVADNKVTGPVPTDRESRDLFYAAGKKPWSIQIPGIGWVPLVAFGPLSVAMGLGASWKYYNDQSPDKFNDSAAKKFQKTLLSQLQVWGEQPMIAGVKNLFDALSGDIDTSLLSSAIFTGEQFMPISGFDRYMATLIDPVFRSVKGEGATGIIKRDIPFASKTLQPFLSPEGEPSKRNITNYAAPYAVGFPNAEYEAKYQELLRAKQFEKISTKAKSDIQKVVDRIDNISQNVSLSEEDREKQLAAEEKKIDAITAEMELKIEKAEPFLQPE